MSRYACADPEHIGDRYIAHPLDAFEERIEWRSMVGQVSRKNVQVLAPICRECRDHRIRAAQGGRLTRQGQFFVETSSHRGNTIMGDR